MRLSILLALIILPATAVQLYSPELLASVFSGQPVEKPGVLKTVSGQPENTDGRQAVSRELNRPESQRMTAWKARQESRKQLKPNVKMLSVLLLLKEKR